MPAQPAFQAWCGSGISVRCNNDLQPLPDMAQNLMGHVVIGFTSRLSSPRSRCRLSAVGFNRASQSDSVLKYKSFLLL
jgi:hypothetical protein